MAEHKKGVQSSKIHVINNPRQDLGDTRDLKEDIRTNGLLNPILVCPHPEKKGEYLLIDGQRRLAVMKELHRYKVDVFVDTDVDPDVAMLSANLHRKDLSSLEKAQGIKDLMEKKGLKAEEVAKTLSISQGQVSQALKLLEQPAVIQKAVEKGNLTPTAVRELARIDDEGTRVKLAARSEGLAVDDVKEMISDVLDKEKRKKKAPDTGKRRGRPTRMESRKPAKADPDAKYSELEPQPFRKLLQAYLYSHYSLAADKKRRPASLKIPKEMGIKRKEYLPEEEAFMEGFYQAMSFTLGLTNDIELKGLDKVALPIDPLKPKGERAPLIGDTEKTEPKPAKKTAKKPAKK